MLQACLLVALGSALGGVGRFLLVQVVDARLAACWPGFPWGTLLVNVLGCLAVGAIAGGTDRDWVRQFAVIGVLGGFTTFSAFSWQTLQLAASGRAAQAMAYVVLSLAVCLAAAWTGWILTRPAS